MRWRVPQLTVAVDWLDRNLKRTPVRRRRIDDIGLDGRRPLVAPLRLRAGLFRGRLLPVVTSRSLGDASLQFPFVAGRGLLR